VAKVLRTWCRTDGVHQVQVPWAREGSGFYPDDGSLDVAAQRGDARRRHD
jgi:hypothetical protein